MIPKPGKNREVESYRPISLLPIMSKLFEKLIFKRWQRDSANASVWFHKKITRQETRYIVSLTSLKKLLKTKACALLSFLTLHKFSTEYGIEAYFINWDQLFPIISIYYWNLIWGACRSIVVKALCYKPEGRGFEIRWGEWFLSVCLIFPAALGLGVYSASNRNEYQEYKNNVSGE
jgi:hypothetical protein